MDDGKYSQAGITVKILAKHDSVRATAIMLSSFKFDVPNYFSW